MGLGVRRDYRDKEICVSDDLGITKISTWEV